ncbi:hypothetical protein [Actinocrispum wychmicini]|uniref:Uncharacterized protein n=1 Tax=Actinocrispum wychmicini TaxID=1213861 RepID=A0A4R2JSM8_9PSEU|nr:hypothetical protein [Actinocrispum wychmicini]TCO57175.1 hypothetical protein EV192_106652 [Actinocrispum wychmicini]
MTTRATPMIVPGRATPPEPAGNPTLGNTGGGWQCRGCGRDLVKTAAYRESPQLRATCVRHGGHDLCKTCYVRAWRHGMLPDPAPAPASSPTACLDCSRPMVTWYRRRQNQARYVHCVVYGGYGMCRACYAWARSRGTLPYPAPRVRVLPDPDRHRPEVTVSTLDS